MKKILSCAVFLLFLVGCSTDEVEELKDLDLTASLSRCELTPDAGTCEAYFVRYYFDPVTKKCTTFVWGGCDGVVPFETMEECQVCVNGK